MPKTARGTPIIAPTKTSGWGQGYPGGTPMAAVCLLFSIVPPPGLAHRLILFLSWPGTHSTLHSMAPSSSFALVLIFIMVKGRGEYWTHCSAIHPWVPCISFPRGLALGGPLGPNTVRPPNLQYPQRLPLTLDRRGSPAVCLDSSNRLFICRATSPPPPPANRIRPTTVLIWILYFASGMVNQEGRPTQHPVLLSPFAKPYLFHVLFFFFFFCSLCLPFRFRFRYRRRRRRTAHSFPVPFHYRRLAVCFFCFLLFPPRPAPA